MFYLFILLPIASFAWNKKLKSFQINENYAFSQQYLQTQVNKIFQYFVLFLNDDISFSK
jgi:hypothetical protein